MNKVAVIISCAMLLLAVSSCDFFRGIAGRPQSAEINAKRARIVQAEAKKAAEEKSRADSLLRIRQFRADSAQAYEALKKLGKLRRASAIKSLPSSSLDKQYYIIAGAFSNEVYADKLASKLSADGFASGILRYRNGLNTVYAAPCGNIVEAYGSWQKIMQLPYASKETWILVNE